MDALEASPLGSEPTLSRPAEEWLNIARKTVGAWSNEYLQRVVWNAQLPLQQQFQEASLVLTGTAQDRSFAYTVSWLGTYEDPEADHYTAAGSGAVSARIYLDAYSYFDVVGHPVLTLQALAARVLRKVSENNIEIGGELSMVTIHRDVSDEHPSANERMPTSDPRVQTAVGHWELMEEVGHQLLISTLSPGPPTPATGS